MYRNNRFGVLALGISIVALIVAFGARFDGPGRWSERGARWSDQPAAQPPAPPVAPQPPAAPADRFGGPRWQHDDRAEWAGGPFGRGHAGWPMFAPFMIFGHIARLATALLLIGLGLRLLRRSRRDTNGPPSDRPFSA